MQLELHIIKAWNKADKQVNKCSQTSTQTSVFWKFCFGRIQFNSVSLIANSFNKKINIFLKSLKCFLLSSSSFHHFFVHNLIITVLLFFNICNVNHVPIIKLSQTQKQPINVAFRQRYIPKNGERRAKRATTGQSEGPRTLEGRRAVRIAVQGISSD